MTGFWGWTGSCNLLGRACYHRIGHRMTPLNKYLVSLPERVLRSVSALSAGLIREIGEVILPRRIRRTKLYQTMVETTLRFLIEQVGQVPDVYPDEGKL